MSLARDLAKLFKGESSPEGRTYQRFRVRMNQHLRVEGIGQHQLPILDLSFGGFSIGNQPELVRRVEVNGAIIPMTIHIIDERLPVNVQVMRVDHLRIGCKLVGQTIDTMVSWHGVLHGLRQGYGLKPQRDHGKDHLTRLKFSKECKLTALCTPPGRVEALKMKFAHDGKIWDFAIDAGKVVTAQGVTDDKPVTLPRRVKTGKLEKRVLRQVIFILSGIADDRTYQQLKPVIPLCLAELQPPA